MFIIACKYVFQPKYFLRLNQIQSKMKGLRSQNQKWGWGIWVTLSRIATKNMDKDFSK